MGQNIKRINIEKTLYDSFFRCSRCKTDFQVEYLNASRNVEFCPCCGIPFESQRKQKRRDEDFDE